MSSKERIQTELEELTNVSDIVSDSTLQSSFQLAGLLSEIVQSDEKIDVIVALGAGRGALADALGTILGVSSVHAIDIQTEACEAADQRGLLSHNIDLETQTLPFEDGSIDLVVSFGLLEHLTWYDNVLSETERVLRDSGYSIFAMPNMAGWTNRLSLLTGHQPRNVEFSQDKPFGIMDAYDTDNTVGHVHTPTVSAFRELLEFHNFEVIDTVGLHPYQEGRLVALIDRLVDGRPSLCRRFAILSRYRSGSEQ